MTPPSNVAPPTIIGWLIMRMRSDFSHVYTPPVCRAVYTERRRSGTQEMSGELSDFSDLREAALRAVDSVIEDEVENVVTSIHVDRDQVSAVWNQALLTALQATPIKQFGVGFGVGWLSGYLFRRVSRTAAFLVGCGFLALQGASALGLISINWRLVGRAAQQRLSRVGRLASQAGLTTESGSASDKVAEFCRRHGYVSSGFAAGAIVAITF